MLDVAGAKERHRNKRLRRLLFFLAPIALWAWWRALTHKELIPLPSLPQDAGLWIPFAILFLLIGVMMLAPMLANSRSPHVVYMPEQIDDIQPSSPAPAGAIPIKLITCQFSTEC